MTADSHSSKQELRSHYKNLLRTKLQAGAAAPGDFSSADLQKQIVQNVSRFMSEHVLHRGGFGRLPIADSSLADEEVYWGTYQALPFEASAHSADFTEEGGRANSSSRTGAHENDRRLNWVYPRMNQDRLEFILPRQVDLAAPGRVELKAPAPWQKDARFGVLEPSQGEVIPLGQIQGILIPALAFDRYGNRLGRGKGFYDQTLSAFNGIKVGIGFSWQISQDELPHEAHDVVMNWLVTEDSFIQCNKNCKKRF